MSEVKELPPRGKKCPAKPGQRITYILTDRKPFHHATLEDAKRERAYLTAKHKKDFRLLKVLNVSSDELEKLATDAAALGEPIQRIADLQTALIDREDAKKLIKLCEMFAALKGGDS